MASMSRKFVIFLFAMVILCANTPCFASARDYLAPAGAASGAIAGAKIGAAFGFFAGPAGSGIGALVGGIAGAVAGDGAGRIMDWVLED